MPEHLHALHAQCFDAPWSVQSFAELLAQESTILIHPNDYSFGLFRLMLDELEVLTLAVAPAARRQGLAKAIMQEAEKLPPPIRGRGGEGDELRPSAVDVPLLTSPLQGEGLRRIFLEVAHTNEAALGLYQSLGYTQIGLRKAYYADGADAITMQKTLD